MAELLGADQIVIHPFVIGELALGNLPRRTHLLNDLGELQRVSISEIDEVMTLIETSHLVGGGLGWVDVNLLASAVADKRIQLWTRDKRLSDAAQRFHVGFSPVH